MSLRKFSGGLSVSGYAPVSIVAPGRINVTSSTDSIEFGGDVELTGDVALSVRSASFRSITISGGTQFSLPEGFEIVTGELFVAGSCASRIPSLSISDRVVIEKGGQLIANNVTVPKVIVRYSLTNLPLALMNVVRPPESIELVYVDDHFSEATKSELFRDAIQCANLSLVCGQNFKCNASDVVFRSDIAQFSGAYSILAAECDGTCLRLLSNPLAPEPPTASPIPPAPTSTPVPDNTHLYVAIASALCILLFGLMIFLLYKFMNRKKAYLKTDTTPLVDAWS